MHLKLYMAKVPPQRKGKKLLLVHLGSCLRLMGLLDRPIVDPFEQHIGYNPEDPGLSVHILSPIPEGETPRTVESQPEPGR